MFFYHVHKDMVDGGVDHCDWHFCFEGKSEIYSRCTAPEQRRNRQWWCPSPPASQSASRQKKGPTRRPAPV